MIITEQKVYPISREKLDNPKKVLHDLGFEVGAYADEFLSSPEFDKSYSETGLVNICLIKFDKDYLISEILEEIEKAGYGLPIPQDAVRFALECPEVQKEYPIAFLHNPWVSPETGGKNTLILRSYSGNKYLHMHLFDSRWYSHIRFAVIKK